LGNEIVPVAISAVVVNPVELIDTTLELFTKKVMLLFDAQLILVEPLLFCHRAYEVPQFVNPLLYNHIAEPSLNRVPLDIFALEFAHQLGLNYYNLKSPL
jgi:hypothetical protein